MVQVSNWTTLYKLSVDSVTVHLGFQLAKPLTDEQGKAVDDLVTKMVTGVGELSQISDDAGHAHRWNSAKKTFDSLATRIDGLSQGLEVVLGSMLVNGWTAFESAATDLWVAAVNGCPDTFGRAALSNQHTFPDSDRSNKSVIGFINTLIGLNQAGRVGSMIKEAERFNFNRLDGIRSAYETTFGSCGKALFADAGFQDLRVLEGIRNVLVHRGGMADSQYRKRYSENRAHYERIGLICVDEGQRIYLDGTIVNALLESVYRFTRDMFHGIDTLPQKEQC